MRGTSWCQEEGSQKSWVAYGVKRSYGVADGMGVCGLGGVGHFGRLGKLNHRDAWWLTKWEREAPSGCMETQKAKGPRWLCGTEN